MKGRGVQAGGSKKQLPIIPLVPKNGMPRGKEEKMRHWPAGAAALGILPDPEAAALQSAPSLCDQGELSRSCLEAVGGLPHLFLSTLGPCEPQEQPAMASMKEKPLEYKGRQNISPLDHSIFPAHLWQAII